MNYSLIAWVHILGGITGMLSGFLALFARKGGRMHRKAGNIFVVAMLIMSAGGAYSAFQKSQPLNIVAGTFTFYLVGTAWLTVRRRQDRISAGDYASLLFGIATVTIAMILGQRGGREAIGATVFGSIALLCVIGDVRLLVRGGIAGAQRMVRHLWRMCFGLFIAAGSFFLGQSSDPVFRRTGLRARLFPPEIRKTGLNAIPVLVIIGMMLFWLGRVWFTNTYKTPRTAEPLPRR
ncbi:MAG TPA: hypothetical protein VJZ00_20630 [Thermoanaerobaculia bacterium]|nr:hypothetical protein [Thermoanaerobaculia bacterium]